MPKRPAAVEAAEAEVNQIMADLKEGKIPGQEGNTETPSAPVVVPPGLPPLAVAKKQETPGEPAPSEPAQPVTPAVETPGPVASDIDSLRAEILRLTQSQSVLEGKYNAEVPRLHEENKQLREENQRLMAAATTPPASDTGKVSEEAEKAVEAIRNKYGDDLADQFLAIAKGYAQPQVTAPEIDMTKYTGQIDEIKTELSTVRQTQEQTQRERYFGWLDTNIPNWEQINKDQGFMKWLAGIAPYSGGKSYHTLLTEAHSAQQGQTVKEIFDAYTGQFGQLPPGGGEPQITPDTQGGGSPEGQGAHGEPRVWKESEISAVYNAKAQGELAADVFAAYEQEIHTAQAEGRVLLGQ